MKKLASVDRVLNLMWYSAKPGDSSITDIAPAFNWERTLRDSLMQVSVTKKKMESLIEMNHYLIALGVKLDMKTDELITAAYDDVIIYMGNYITGNFTHYIHNNSIGLATTQEIRHG